ncbi:hypothetical protein OE88DRAFT_1655854 [Heliocybe sulcata]|uniref:Zinc finger C2H2 LYAR-type domain-containing protein n=1 Tax=Heliocybe sulcata TaxID=5364 RepID=A0A5C3N8K1_9AGAM|nr:hypothetical protein OE88DRAFT_1655854 [Heliocybe sulcata]
MVSFNCDACLDVVKKPKLDQHSWKCGASFTCIDCSTTFHKPAEWKGHTTCISEAEKYQKSLYKGPKGKQQSGQDGRKQNQNQKAAGKYNGCQHAQRPRHHATGANETPLGTPARMSPVSPPSLSPAPEPAAPTPSLPEKNSEDVAPQEIAKEGKKEKKKKDKKRKSRCG